MTTIVYKEEMITSKSPISGTPRNVKTKTFTVQIMGSEGSQSGGSGRTGGGGKPSQRHSRGGSPKPNKKFDVRRQPHGYQYDPNIFTITAYLPHEGGKRLKLQCVPGQSVQQVIESAEIPNLSHSGYQVYQFPSRALLNPEKDASVLQDQEISIEPMRVSSPDEVDDDRLSIVKELLRTEDTYLENLRNIFDIYMEPLKKWGLPQSDMNIMFRSLSRLCDVLMNFFSELELSVMHWNPTSTVIGGLFKQYRSFWEMYSEYSRSYAKACKLLKDKRAMDESFNRFLEMKRGAAMHTLESLMLLPVQRIYEYHKLLMRLYSLTPKEHPDHHDLRDTISCVGSMVQAREHQLNQNQNEIKLEQVQIRFPHDNLNLFQSLDVIESRGAKRSKTYSSHSMGTPMRRPHHNWMSSPSLGSASLPQDDVDGSKNRARLYLSEGPVRIYTSGVQSHDRHLFLFDDLLIISKPIKQKSQHKLYKRKGQRRLSELWVTKCTEKALESVLAPDTYFVIGWPFTNCVAAFSTPEEKTLWFNLLKKYIAAQRQKAEPDKNSVQVLNFTINPPNLTPVWMKVHAQEDARSLLQRAIETMAIAVSEANCQLWVKISKDEAILLAGHEYPYGIQMFHNRHKLEFSDNKPSQLQFFVKRKETVSLSAPKSLHKRSVISLPWKRPKSKSKSKGHRGHRVFGAPLDVLIVNNELPELLQEMLVRLYAEAPASRGIFRHSANHKRVRGLMESIDNRAHVNLYECSIHEVGALLKNLLRNVPGGILLSSRYTEFVATNDFKDIANRAQQIQKVINRLPGENQLFLTYLMPLLHHISKNHEVNGMNSINLAICFAPSLLWPITGLDVIKNEVPPLIQFMIEQCPKIFGAELPVLYKQAILDPSPGVEDMEFTINAPATKQFVPTKVDDGEYSQHSSHKRSDSIGSSMSEGSTAEDHTSSLLRARASGLTLSDSQLSQVSQADAYECDVPRRNAKRGQIKASGRYIHGGDPGPNLVQSPVDQPSAAKRAKKARIPERSSSLHGPNDMPYSRTRYVRPRPVDPAVRRKSIAVQEPIHPKFAPDFDVMPPSPNSSMSSSSHSYSPKMHRIHHQYYPHGYGRHDEATSSSHPGQKKKSRKLTQYSHSFTSKDMEKPSRLIPSSSSFYDKLLPLDATESRIRPDRGFAAQIKLLGSEEDEDLHEQRSILTSTPGSFGTASSTHSVSGSSISTQTRPSNLSLATGGSGSPDLLRREDRDLLPREDRGEFIKVAISERFKLNNSGGAVATPTYPQERIRVDISEATPSREGFVSPGSESGQDSLERIQKKFQERKRLDSNGSESAFSKSSSYKGFLNTQQNKESLTSLTEEASFDDRPECDFHLGSLTRQRTLAAGDDPNKLYGSNGYNSDTESAPSRTLSRPGKIKEVSSPVKTTMPSRYFMKPSQSSTPTTSASGTMHLSSHQATSQAQLKHQPQQRGVLTQQNNPGPSQSQRKSELTTSLGTGYDLYRNVEIPVIAEPLVTTTRTITKSSSSGSKYNRPRSGNGGGDSRVERLTEVYKAKEQEQVNANIEDVKVKLGLIPPVQRQRSKSTSENEAMKILHKIGTDPAATASSKRAEEEEWASKHKEWLSSAPTEDERKRARENYSKSQFQRMEYKSRSLRGSDGGSDKPTTIVTTKVSYTPEAKRKFSTMPESPHVVKTVKIRTYEIPEVQKIRRINLRTYH